jgi:hypothetical protein
MQLCSIFNKIIISIEILIFIQKFYGKKSNYTKVEKAKGGPFSILMKNFFEQFFGKFGTQLFLRIFCIGKCMVLSGLGHCLIFYRFLKIIFFRVVLPIFDLKT